MDKLRLSPSRMSEFKNCAQRYKYRAIDLLPEPPSIDAERGTLIHTVLEDLFDSPASERTIETAVNLLPSRWRNQVKEKPEIAAFIPSELQEKEWFDRATALLTNYFTLERPASFEPTHREMHLEFDIAPEIYLHGFVDRLDVAPTGEVRIVDYKTGKSPKPGWEGKALFQLRIYALLYWKTFGVLPTLLQLVYLGDSRLIKDSPSEEALIETEKAILDIAEEMLEAARTGQYPTQPSKLCDWCSFKNICPAFN